MVQGARRRANSDLTFPRRFAVVTGHQTWTIPAVGEIYYSASASSIERTFGGQAKEGPSAPSGDFKDIKMIVTNGG